MRTTAATAAPCRLEYSPDILIGRMADSAESAVLVVILQRILQCRARIPGTGSECTVSPPDPPVPIAPQPLVRRDDAFGSVIRQGVHFQALNLGGCRARNPLAILPVERWSRAFSASAIPCWVRRNVRPSGIAADCCAEMLRPSIAYQCSNTSVWPMSVEMGAHRPPVENRVPPRAPGCPVVACW